MTQISVAGEGKLELKPDIAYFNVAIQSHDATAEDARETSENCIRQIVKVLSDFVKDTNYTVTPPTIQPNYEYIKNKRTIKGYNAYANIPVRVDQLEKISELVDIINKLSPEIIQAANLSFAATKEKELMNEARTLAFQDALNKANHYASRFNLEVTELLSLQENGHSTRNHASKQMMFSACGDTVGATRGSGPSVEISGGQLDITINIEAIFIAQPSRSSKNE